MNANEIGSEAWCAAMSEVLADVELPEVQATVEQRIGDGNSGPVIAYRLVLHGGRACLEPVPVPDSGTDGGTARTDGGRSSSMGGIADDSEGIEETGHRGDSDSQLVVMSQSRETAESVRRGEIGALAALQAGLIRVSGDMRVLIAAADALAVVDAALSGALAGDQHSASGAPRDDAQDLHDPDSGAEG